MKKISSFLFTSPGPSVRIGIKMKTKYMAEQFELNLFSMPFSTKCPDCGQETGGGRCDYHQEIRDDGAAAERELEEMASQW